VASPMPEAAPVTTATLSRSLTMRGSHEEVDGELRKRECALAELRESDSLVRTATLGRGAGAADDSGHSGVVPEDLTATGVRPPARLAPPSGSRRAGTGRPRHHRGSRRDPRWAERAGDELHVRARDAAEKLTECGQFDCRRLAWQEPAVDRQHACIRKGVR